MSSPMIDRIREIPLINEKEKCYPIETEETGFPFDDDREDQEEAPFRSQLDDIAARHPEFAQHLGSFPFRSGTRSRTRVPEDFPQQRFPDRSFGDRFEEFGFPFDEPFRDKEEKPYYQRYPKYYPTQNSQEEDSEQSSSNQDPQSTNAEVNQDSVEQQGPERGRRSKNIQQSNTVDLGQKQEPVDDRNQRSMSAPPPNNRTRFVSSINIPVNQPSGKANVNDVPQPSAPSQPQERVIPIHVEGRDEPVLPKKFSSQNTSHPQAHPQQPQPCSDKFFTQRSPNFSQYFKRDQPYQNEWLPRGFQTKQPQGQTNFSQSQRGRSPQGQRGRSPQPQSKAESAPQTTNIPAQAQPEPKLPEEAQVESEGPMPQEPPKPQAPGKLDPIDQIKSIQKDVSELMGKVGKFGGKPRDKEFLYLDEMLTRNLIKLDNIDTQGQENIRKARKEAIKCIEKCISILESKANANVEDKSTKGEEIETTEQVAEETKDKEMEVGETVEDVKDEKIMEVENVEAPVTSESVVMEKEGESLRTPVQKEEPMDIASVITDETNHKTVTSSVGEQPNIIEMEEKKDMITTAMEEKEDVESGKTNSEQGTEVKNEENGKKSTKKKVDNK